MSVFSDIVDEIHVQLGDSSVKKLVGRKGLKQHEQRRRIVWIRGSGSAVIQPGHAGGKIVTGATQDARHRQIYTLNEAVEAHIFAETEDAIEQLFSNLLAAMKTTLAANWAPGSYDWETETGNDGVATGHTIRGPKVLFKSSWMLPTTDEQKPLTILTGHTHVCEIQSPDGLSTEVE